MIKSSYHLNILIDYPSFFIALIVTKYCIQIILENIYYLKKNF